MKKKYFLYILFICLNCEAQSSNEIVIKFNDFPTGDWRFSYFDTLDEQIKVIVPNSNTLKLKWSNLYTFALTTFPFKSFYPINVGDTITIYNILNRHPNIKIYNSKYTEFEINFPTLLTENNCNPFEFYELQVIPQSIRNKLKLTETLGSVNSCYLKSLNLLDSCYKNGKISKNYYDWIEEKMNLSYNSSSLKLREKEFQKIDSKKLQINNYLQRTLVKDYFINELLKTSWNSLDFKKAFDYLVKNTNTQYRDYLLLFCIKNLLEKKTGTEVSVYFKTFIRECKNDTYINFIKNNYIFSYKLDNLSTKSSAFEIINPKGISTTLIKVLKNIPTKFAIIDLWASWCAPCRVEINNIIQENILTKKTNYTVIFLSIDKQRGNWLRAINEDKTFNYKYNYLNVISNNIFFKELNVSSVPRYIIMDKVGNIINRDSENTIKILRR